MAFPPRPPRVNFNPRFRKAQQQEHRTNQMIRVPEVRLVGENIEVGVYPIAEALRMAQDQQLDLVEISPAAVPPVCKIIDYNKFLYDKKKKEKEMKAKSKTSASEGKFRTARRRQISRWKAAHPGSPKKAAQHLHRPKASSRKKAA